MQYSPGYFSAVHLKQRIVLQTLTWVFLAAQTPSVQASEGASRLGAPRGEWSNRDGRHFF